MPPGLRKGGESTDFSLYQFALTLPTSGPFEKLMKSMVVQSFSRIQVFATPRTAARPSLSFTIS